MPPGRVAFLFSVYSLKVTLGMGSVNYWLPAWIRTGNCPGRPAWCVLGIIPALSQATVYSNSFTSFITLVNQALYSAQPYHHGQPVKHHNACD